MSFGVKSEGFVLKRLSDILNDIRFSLSSVTDPISGETLNPDLSDENDPLIQQVNAFGDALAECWEHLQLAYNQFDPLKNSGAGQSGVVQLNGIKRRPGTYSQVVVTIVGTPGLTIPEGRRITTLNDTPVFVLPLTQVSSGGTISVVATCEEMGPFSVDAGELIKILNPVSGWASVINPSFSTVGTYEETDEELRARQRISTSNPAQTIPEAIASGIASLNGVTYVRIYQNMTLETDIRGIPAKSIAPIVIGGDDYSIAQVLFEKMAAGGADSFGVEEVNIVDTLGYSYPMRFSRPIAVPVFIALSISIYNEDVYPSNGSDLIKAALLSFTVLGVDSSRTRGGYGPGQSVYATELVIPVYTIPGVKVNSLVVGVTETPEDAEVVIDWNEIATFDSDNIDITVV